MNDGKAGNNVNTNDNGVNESSQLTLFHINIQCLANKVDLLSLFLDDKQYQLLLLSEHWQDNNRLPRIKIPGYALTASYCREVHSHGGVACYAHSSIRSRGVDLSGYCIEFHSEFAAVELIGFNCVVIGVYRSPSNGVFSVFMEQLEKLLNYLTINFKYIIICGDFNCDNAIYPKISRDLGNLMNGFNLRQVALGLTRVTVNSSTAPDAVYTNFPHNKFKVNVLDPGISDHAGQVLKVDVDHSRPQTNHLIRHVSYPGLLRLKSAISTVDWNLFQFSAMNPERAMSVFVEFLREMVSDCSVVTLANRRGGSPVFWFSNELKSLRNRVEALKTICLVRGTQDCWDAYGRLRLLYRKQVALCKRAAYTNLIANSDNKQRACWKLINYERSSGNDTYLNSPQISVDDFNTYFTNIADSIVKNLPPSDRDIEDFLSLIPPNSGSFFLHPVTISEMKSTIMTLKNKNTLDFYDMNAKLIKFICDEIVDPLTSIFNSCISQGIFPSALKIIKIIPLLKKGDREDASNYRPIAIVPTLGKIFESILRSRLEKFLDSNRTIAQQQFGFRRGCSAVQAVASLIADVVEGFDEGERTAVALCDLTRAFDCVSPKILIKKLHLYGVRGIALDLFKSYLSDRKQYTQVGGKKSTILPQEYGIPQGSILGPLLFNLYVNDLSLHVEGAKTLQYADDTTLYTRSKRADTATDRTASALARASSWFLVNGLSLNGSKTQSIVLSTDKLAAAFEPVSLLGLRLDQRLTWAAQVDMVCGKISRGLFVLRRLMSLVPVSVVRLAYFAMIQAHLTYGILLWGGSAEAHRLFVLQKRAVRIMTFKKPGTHCSSLFKQLRLLTLPSLYIHATCVHIHKIAPSLRLRADIHTYNTRCRNLFDNPASRTNTAAKNKLNLNLYNKLPDDIKSLGLENFKRTLRNLLIENCFYSVDDFLNMRFS